MKLRLHKNSIRIRLNREDLQILLKKKILKQDLKNLNQSWNYQIKIDQDFNANISSEGFTFCIPMNDANKLKDDDTEQLNYQSGDLKVSIQKEFACLHPDKNNSEDKNNDLFFKRRS